MAGSMLLHIEPMVSDMESKPAAEWLPWCKQAASLAARGRDVLALAVLATTLVWCRVRELGAG